MPGRHRYRYCHRHGQAHPYAYVQAAGVPHSFLHGAMERERGGVLVVVHPPLWNISETLQVEVSDEVLAKVHGYLRSGPHSELTDDFQSPLRLRVRNDEVKSIVDKKSIPLPGVDVPLPEKADSPLVYDATTFSASTFRPVPVGEPLTRLDDLPFVAMEVWIAAWNIDKKPTYTFYFDSILLLGSESMWDDELQRKGAAR